MTARLDVSIRPAAFNPSVKSGRPILQEVYSFAERAGIEADAVSEVDPLALFDPGRLVQCDEAFVAVAGQRIVGAVTLAFHGVYAPKMPTLDALYVLPEFQRQGIGLALVERAIRRFVEMDKVPVFCRVESAEMRALLSRLNERLPDWGQHVQPWLDVDA